MIGRYSTAKIMMEASKLEMEEFLGVCRILEVKLTEEDEPRDFGLIWIDVCNKVEGLDRTKRKNLMKLLRAANEGR